MSLVCYNFCLIASPNKTPPVLGLDWVPNIPYFWGQWVYIENLDRLDPNLSWEAGNGTGVKWLAYDDPDDLYSDEEPGPLGLTLLSLIAVHLYGLFFPSVTPHVIPTDGP